MRPPVFKETDVRISILFSVCCRTSSQKPKPAEPYDPNMRPPVFKETDVRISILFSVCCRTSSQKPRPKQLPALEGHFRAEIFSEKQYKTEIGPIRCQKMLFTQIVHGNKCSLGHEETFFSWNFSLKSILEKDTVNIQGCYNENQNQHYQGFYDFGCYRRYTLIFIAFGVAMDNAVDL